MVTNTDSLAYSKRKSNIKDDRNESKQQCIEFEYKNLLKLFDSGPLEANFLYELCRQLPCADSLIGRAIRVGHIQSSNNMFYRTEQGEIARERIKRVEEEAQNFYSATA